MAMSFGFDIWSTDVKLAYIHRTTGDEDIYFVSHQGTKTKMVDCFFRVTGKKPELWNPVTGARQSVGLWRIEKQGTRVTLPLEPNGSWFVIFRKPAPSKTVTYSALTKNEEQTLPGSEWLPEITDQDKGVQMVVWDNGQYKLQTSNGSQKSISVETLPTPMVLNQPWIASFTPGWGAPAKIELPQLIDLSQHTDPGVRYYSGTVTYKTTFNLSFAFVQHADRLNLDLGQVDVLAEVIVNGKNLGILWCDPFRVDITAAAKPGDNSLEIRVTNLWVNRLIGDEQYPDDCEWEDNKSLKDWPTWLQEGKPRPSAQRLAFATWKFWTKDDVLPSSGLIGPVYLRAGKLIEVDR
jgi:hypothetical protein